MDRETPPAQGAGSTPQFQITATDRPPTAKRVPSGEKSTEFAHPAVFRSRFKSPVSTSTWSVPVMPPPARLEPSGENATARQPPRSPSSACNSAPCGSTRP